MLTTGYESKGCFFLCYSLEVARIIQEEGNCEETKYSFKVERTNFRNEGKYLDGCSLKVIQEARWEMSVCIKRPWPIGFMWTRMKIGQVIFRIDAVVLKDWLCLDV